MILTAVFRLCGQFETGPTAVCDQSNVRINAPISPPPEKTESIAVELMLSLFPTPSSAVSGSWARCCHAKKAHLERLLSLHFILGLRGLAH
jgi:hypothetical protein